MRPRTRSRRSEAGYNLVETLVALAMTGIVIMSIMALFFMGRRNVYAGRQLTAANAVATRALEDLAQMSPDDVLMSFGIDDTDTLGSNVVAGKTYPGSVLRATNGTIDASTDPGGYLARWKDLFPGSTFANGRLTLVVTPASPLVSTSPVESAQVIRVRGVIEWSEGPRRRSLEFDSSKLHRP